MKHRIPLPYILLGKKIACGNARLGIQLHFRWVGARLISQGAEDVEQFLDEMLPTPDRHRDVKEGAPATHIEAHGAGGSGASREKRGLKDVIAMQVDC